MPVNTYGHKHPPDPGPKGKEVHDVEAFRALVRSCVRGVLPVLERASPPTLSGVVVVQVEDWRKIDAMLRGLHELVS